MLIAIFGSTYQGQYISKVASLISSFEAQGCRVMVEPVFRGYLEGHGVVLPRGTVDFDPELQGVSIAISFGGDGTFLRAAQWIGSRRIPILGINTGHLGYMAAISIDDAPSMVEDVIKGNYIVEDRSLIEVGGDAIGGCGLWPYALNEVAVLKEDTASMITVDAKINSLPLATYLADGLIVSTPTGSTGYNLSVGGPIVAPNAPAWIITPVAAHSLTMRPLVVSDDATVELTTTSRVNDYRVSLDGRSATLPVGSTISLRRAPFSISVIQRPGHTFATTLRQKLLWGQPLVNS